MAQSPMAERVRKHTGLPAVAAVPLYRRPAWALACVIVPVAITALAVPSIWAMIAASALGGALVGGLTRWYYVARTADRLVLLRCKPFTARPVAVVCELQRSDVVPLGTVGVNTKVRAGIVTGMVPKRWNRELQALTR
ncbi:MAG: hypothetical protein RL238_1803 [Actinomycetota bacterium]